jgi:hypothetical protein
MGDPRGCGCTHLRTCEGAAALELARTVGASLGPVSLLSPGRQPKPEVLIGTPLAGPAVIFSRALIAPGALRCSVPALVPLADLTLVLPAPIHAERAASDGSSEALSSSEVPRNRTTEPILQATAGSALSLCRTGG